MKNANFDLYWTFLALAFAAGILLVVSSCQFTPEETAARDELIALHDEITADGIVTDEERERFIAKAEETEEKIDWTELIGSTLTSIILSIVGVNTMRNRSLPGTNRKS